MAQIQQGLAAWGATGAKVLRPYALTLLAEALAVVDNRGAPLGSRVASTQGRAPAGALGGASCGAGNLLSSSP
jgi:hypothetical protein